MNTDGNRYTTTIHICNCPYRTMYATQIKILTNVNEYNECKINQIMMSFASKLIKFKGNTLNYSTNTENQLKSIKNSYSLRVGHNRYFSLFPVNATFKESTESVFPLNVLRLILFHRLP